MTFGNWIPMQLWLRAIKNGSAVFILLFLLSCSAGENKSAEATSDGPPYKYYLGQNDKNNWGYFIELNHKLVINQFTIPALNGNQPFKTKEQAAKVGELVTQKLNQGKRPVISKAELDSLGIIQQNHVLQNK